MPSSDGVTGCEPQWISKQTKYYQLQHSSSQRNHITNDYYYIQYYSTTLLWLLCNWLSMTQSWRLEQKQSPCYEEKSQHGANYDRYLRKRIHGEMMKKFGCVVPLDAHPSKKKAGLMCSRAKKALDYFESTPAVGETLWQWVDRTDLLWETLPMPWQWLRAGHLRFFLKILSLKMIFFAFFQINLTEGRHFK